MSGGIVPGRALGGCAILLASLADCGVTSAEIKTVRDILLEREPAKTQ